MGLCYEDLVAVTGTWASVYATNVSSWARVLTSHEGFGHRSFGRRRICLHDPLGFDFRHDLRRPLKASASWGGGGSSSRGLSDWEGYRLYPVFELYPETRFTAE